jgi:antitoxin HicB
MPGRRYQRGSRLPDMQAQKLSRRGIAERMGTSLRQVGCLLDPTDSNVTFATLQRAAEMLGRKVRLDLV